MKDSKVTTIDRYWLDSTIYLINFNVFDDRYGFRKIEKKIILKEELSLIEVEDIVRSKFRNVIEITHIDY
ncbi:hypothetical protein, partial [Carnobacterium maltaromaticum]